MRRSGAPSQLLGNAVKKPQFMPPGASGLHPAAESKPLAPNLGLGNALDKVQRSLSAPVVNKTAFSVQAQTGQTAPGLSKALARVLSATESKENEEETKCEDSTGECAENINLSGEATLTDSSSLFLFVYF
ncbi:hypothetical protein CHARACLAT_017803 [Characodon lateralis]|uniref:Uncharacterized protein n=1 Tax=Characodon lateralis TaxID=208331 RepID=A0ABU7CYI6_9TELE|nr:hypothetical protein [Characodon lateralis]